MREIKDRGPTVTGRGIGFPDPVPVGPKKERVPTRPESAELGAGGARERELRRVNRGDRKREKGGGDRGPPVAKDGKATEANSRRERNRSLRGRETRTLLRQLVRPLVPGNVTVRRRPLKVNRHTAPTQARECRPDGKEDLREKERGAGAKKRKGRLRIRENTDGRERARTEMREHPFQRERDGTKLRKTTAGMGTGRGRDGMRKGTEPARDGRPCTSLSVWREDRSIRPNFQFSRGERRKVVKENAPFHGRRKIPRAGGRKSRRNLETLGERSRGKRRNQAKRLPRELTQRKRRGVRGDKSPPRGARFESLLNLLGGESGNRERGRKAESSLENRERGEMREMVERLGEPLKKKKRKGRRRETPRNNPAGRVVNSSEGVGKRPRGEREPGGRGIGENRADKGLVEDDQRLLGRPPGLPCNGLEGTKARVDLEDRLPDVVAKREGSIKRDPEEGRIGVETERGSVDSKVGSEIDLTRVKREKGGLTLSHVDGQGPSDGPSVEGIKSKLDFRDRGGEKRGGGPDSKIVRIEREGDRGGEGEGEVIDKEKEEKRPKHRSLRDAPTLPKGRRAYPTEPDVSPAVGEVTTDPMDEAAGQPKGAELGKEGHMPNGVESLGEINGRQDRPTRRFGGLQPIGDRLREEEELVKGRSAGAKPSLKRREKVPLLNEEDNPGEDHLLKELGTRRDEGDGPIGRRERSVLAWLQDRNDLRHLPGGRKGGGGPRKVEDMEKEEEGRGGQVGKEGVGDTRRVGSSGGREGGESLLQLLQRERRGEIHILSKVSTDLRPVATGPTAEVGGDRGGEMREIEGAKAPSLGSRGGGAIDGGIRRGRRSLPRDAPKKVVGPLGVSSGRQSGRGFMPGVRLS